MLTMRAMRRHFAAMPAELYLIRLVHNQTRRAFPGERLWTATELLAPASIRFLRIRNREGCDIYIQPYAGNQNAGYILVDLDRADSNVVSRMRERGHSPCLVLQTSPGHQQAWTQVSLSPLEPCIASAIARQLARDYSGDPASADWRHLGRLAGFTNQKPARRICHGYAPWVKVVYACRGLAPQAEALLQSARNLQQSPGLSNQEACFPSKKTQAIAAAEAQTIYSDYLRRWHIFQRFSPPDWSIVDLWVARDLLTRGVPISQVEDVLRFGSPQFPRKHGDPEDYLRRTVTRASFSPMRGAV